MSNRRAIGLYALFLFLFKLPTRPTTSFFYCMQAQNYLIRGRMAMITYWTKDNVTTAACSCTFNFL